VLSTVCRQEGKADAGQAAAHQREQLERKTITKEFLDTWNHRLPVQIDCDQAGRNPQWAYVT
jgi:hypothetical protein